MSGRNELLMEMSGTDEAIFGRKVMVLCVVDEEKREKAQMVASQGRSRGNSVASHWTQSLKKWRNSVSALLDSLLKTYRICQSWECGEMSKRRFFIQFEPEIASNHP